MIDPRLVAVIRQEPRYEIDVVRASVRRVLKELGLTWSEIIRPGDRVLLKPNFIRESHTERPGEWEQIITHGSVIAAVAFEVADALGGRGTITIADAPQTDSDFGRICSRTGMAALQERLGRDHPGMNVEILDLRREYWRTERGVVVERRRLREDPRGYTLVDLGEHSSFHGKAGAFYGADYDTAFTASHHSNGRHEYLISRSAMDADVFINLPKLKTHKKVGVTLSLKNLVGINGDKNYLPHFCIGTPAQGGDEFPRSDSASRLQSLLISGFKQAAKWSGPAAKLWAPVAVRLGARMFGSTHAVVRSGNWHGNDTTWRMTLDLNRILFHFDGTAQARRKPLRYLTIIDGIVAGEGNGPMEADAKPCGVLVGGTNPVAADWAAAELMGFDWRKIPTIREAFRLSDLPLVDFSPEQIRIVPDAGRILHFRPHFGWTGHIEAENGVGVAEPGPATFP
ncbi:MAG TPA: DUF362 domain-containing protein [Nitrospiria bacterium]|nr:DUF362 domain-containing protein [Nitrospiria bacterium]